MKDLLAREYQVDEGVDSTAADSRKAHRWNEQTKAVGVR